MTGRLLRQIPRQIPGFLLCAALLVPRGAAAGEVQETIDLTGFRPSPVPGEFIAPTIPIHWDSRCIPVPLQINTTLDPVPNPSGPPILTVAQASATIQAAADLWGSVPTSFARVQVVGTTSNPGSWGFDMVNEVTFRTGPGFPRQQASTFSIDFGPIAAVRYTRFLEDFTVADGAYSDGRRPPIPTQGGHPAEVKAATRSKTKAATHSDRKAATFWPSPEWVAGFAAE